MKLKEVERNVARYADMLNALGAEPRLRIIRLLLSAHPGGMVVGDIQKELGITASTLSHHLDKLKNNDLVAVRRDGTFLWCSANAATLRDLLVFLYSECCTRNRILNPDAVVHINPTFALGVFFLPASAVADQQVVRHQLEHF